MRHASISFVHRMGHVIGVSRAYVHTCSFDRGVVSSVVGDRVMTESGHAGESSVVWEGDLVGLLCSDKCSGNPNTISVTPFTADSHPGYRPRYFDATIQQLTTCTVPPPRPAGDTRRVPGGRRLQWSADIWRFAFLRGWVGRMGCVWGVPMLLWAFENWARNVVLIGTLAGAPNIRQLCCSWCIQGLASIEKGRQRAQRGRL